MDYPQKQRLYFGCRTISPSRLQAAQSVDSSKVFDMPHLEVSALSQTSRQLRHETYGLELVLNIFDADQEVILMHIKRLGPDAVHLASVHVTV